MELVKFYEIIVRGNAKGGVLYAPPTWPTPIARDGEEVCNWKSLVLTLQDGPYRNYNMCVGQANIVSEQLKNVLAEYCESNPNIEFLPVKVTSDEYGDRIYYIMHFKIVFDVIDEKRTLYVPGTDSIIKLRLDYNKVEKLKIFNSRPYVNDVIVSEDVRKAIKRHHLDDGIEFLPIYCEKDNNMQDPI